MGNRRTMQGDVISNNMDKTVVVTVKTRQAHPLYKKHIVKSQKFKAHDESNECNVGDKVTLSETRPLSREKRWRIAEILQKAEIKVAAPQKKKRVKKS